LFVFQKKAMITISDETPAIILSPTKKLPVKSTLRDDIGPTNPTISAMQKYIAAAEPIYLEPTSGESSG